MHHKLLFLNVNICNKFPPKGQVISSIPIRVPNNIRLRDPNIFIHRKPLFLTKTVFYNINLNVLCI